MIKITFNGAAMTVTGSSYLVETDKSKFLVDCGMFQGPDVEARNLEDYEFDPREIDFVLLTHAHIDHSGMLPKLVKNGFNGEIYATANTIQISKELLLDSAKIQENNFSRGRYFGKHTKVKALVYNTYDAEKTINMFRAIRFTEEFYPTDEISLKYINAGHILGAASIEIGIKDGEKTKNLLFSGDIGREKHTIIETFDQAYKSTPDYIVMEALYGGIEHPEREEALNQLIEIINETINKGANVFIPVFSVQRTQELLNDFRIAKEKGQIKEEVPFFLDSPLAQRVTDIYVKSLRSGDQNLFTFPNLRYIRKARQSMKLTHKKGQVIMAGSGMADGGRILMHMLSGLKNPRNAVAFVGYQAEGTIGREITDGKKMVPIDDTLVEVKAKIHYIQGFSAHGDTSDYMKWLERHISGNLKRIFLVHADEERFADMKKILDDKKIDDPYVPVWKETVEVP